MKVKVEGVIIGIYEYDSVIVNIEGNKTELVFNKEDNVSQYDGKVVEIENVDGCFTIKQSSATKKKDSD